MPVGCPQLSLDPVNVAESDEVVEAGDQDETLEYVVQQAVDMELTNRVQRHRHYQPHAASGVL